jgi:hypothetical protein
MACDDVEVVDHGDPAEIEQVLAGAAVAGAAALPVADVGQGVLDLDALAELGAPGCCQPACATIAWSHQEHCWAGTAA